MADQADHLRALVRQSSGNARRPMPPSVLFTSGRPGLGTSTVALELAAALASRQLRVVLVDADLQHAGLTRRAAAHATDASLPTTPGGPIRLAGPLQPDPPQPALWDVLSGERTAAEALETVRRDLLLLGCRSAPEKLPRLTPTAPARLLGELGTLTQVPDLILVDCGAGLSPWTHAWWRSVDHVVTITTEEDEAVVDTYALVKLACRDHATPAPALIVNQCTAPATAQQLHARLAQACFHFLGQLVCWWGCLPRNPDWTESFDRPPDVDPFPDALAELALRVATELECGTAFGTPAEKESFRPVVSAGVAVS